MCRGDSNGWKWSSNPQVVRRGLEHEGSEETIDTMCSKNAIGHGQAQHGADIRGPEHFKQFWRGFRGAFSSINIDIHDTIEQDHRVVARWTMAMTHTGTFLGIAPAN